MRCFLMELYLAVKEREFGTFGFGTGLPRAYMKDVLLCSLFGIGCAFHMEM